MILLIKRKEKKKKATRGRIKGKRNVRRRSQEKNRDGKREAACTLRYKLFIIVSEKETYHVFI